MKQCTAASWVRQEIWANAHETLRQHQFNFIWWLSWSISSNFVKKSRLNARRSLQSRKFTKTPVFDFKVA